MPEQNLQNIANLQKLLDAMNPNTLTEKQALEFISKKIGLVQVDPESEKMKDNLDKYLLPHLGVTPKDRLAKAYNLCKLVKKFLKV